MKKCGLLALLIPGIALGQLFAVAPGPRLVTVDPDTGAVVEIGDIDMEGVGLASMEFVGQRLFAVDTNWPNGAWLIEIDTHDGSILSRHEMMLGGVGLVNSVEGMGYDPAVGSLVQAFWRSGSSSTSGSNTLGLLAMDGVITGPIGYGSGADFDGLATRTAAGLMYRVDREPGPNTVEIGLVTYGGSMSSLALYNFDGTLNGVNDVSLATDRGELLAVDSVTRMVHRFDPDTAALLGSVANSVNEWLNVAAYRVPCPADLAPPFGLLDLADVNAFVTGFVGLDHVADLAEPFGVFDLADVNAFVGSFMGGCP